MGKSIQARLREKRPPRVSLQTAAVIKARPTASKRGYDAEWQKLRAQHLARQPACVKCGVVRENNHVDHIVPHRGDNRLRLNPNNLQTMCHSHHSQKRENNEKGFRKRTL
ncbi:MAG: HNH endonuclease [Candidatus Hydrogenedentes bacterium]|nr:HNH endonuclease [Candidatus Hydrogenedentota bacterium]